MKNQKPKTPAELTKSLNELLDKDNSLDLIIKGEFISISHKGHIVTPDNISEQLKELAKESDDPLMLKNSWRISLNLLIAEYIKLYETYENNSK